MYCSSYFAMDYVITLTGTELNKRQAIQRPKQSDSYWRLSHWKRTCFAFLNDWLKENIGSETHQSKQCSKPCVVKSHTEFFRCFPTAAVVSAANQFTTAIYFFCADKRNYKIPSDACCLAPSKSSEEDLCSLDYFSYSKKRSNRFKILIWVQSKTLRDDRILCFYYWASRN